MRIYEINGQPATAAQYGSFIADLFAQGYTLTPPALHHDWSLDAH